MPPPAARSRARPGSWRPCRRFNLKKFDEASQALRALQSETPAAAIANAIGVLELRRSAAAQPGRATYYFSQATELDEADGDLFFNLGYAYWLERDAKAAIYWLREAVRRDPADGDAHFILGTALQQSGADRRGGARTRAGPAAVVEVRRVGEPRPRLAPIRRREAWNACTIS